VGRGDAQGDGAVRSLEDAITLLGQNLFRECPYGGLVFNEKNRLGGAGGLVEGRGCRLSGGGDRLFSESRFGETRVERLEARRREQLPRQNRCASRCTLDLGELLRASGIFARRFEQKLGVDLNYGEEVVELVRDKAGRFVCLFEIVCSYGEVDRRRLLPLLS
jgi:hypothetical protein